MCDVLFWFVDFIVLPVVVACGRSRRSCCWFVFFLLEMYPWRFDLSGVLDPFQKTSPFSKCLLQK
jgi:hypothetical protein